MCQNIRFKLPDLDGPSAELVPTPRSFLACDDGYVVHVYATEGHVFENAFAILRGSLVLSQCRTDCGPQSIGEFTAAAASDAQFLGR